MSFIGKRAVVEALRFVTRVFMDKWLRSAGGEACAVRKVKQVSAYSEKSEDTR
jgi:hypothetical protein